MAKNICCSYAFKTLHLKTQVRITQLKCMDRPKSNTHTQRVWVISPFRNQQQHPHSMSAMPISGRLFICSRHTQFGASRANQVTIIKWVYLHKCGKGTAGHTRDVINHAGQDAPRKKIRILGQCKHQLQFMILEAQIAFAKAFFTLSILTYWPDLQRRFHVWHLLIRHLSW